MAQTIRHKFSRGWGVVRNSLAVIMSARYLIVVPLLGLLVNSLLLASLLVFGFRSDFVRDANGFGFYPKVDALGIAAMIVTYALMVVVNTFLAGVVSHNVLARFDGRRLSLATSFVAAWRKRADLTAYALAHSVVTYVLVVIFERLPFASKLLSWVTAVAWSAGGLFAVPIIMQSEAKTRPQRAVKASVSMVGQLWQAGLTSQLSIGLMFAAALVAVWGGLTLLMRVIYVMFGQGDGLSAGAGMVSFAVLIAGAVATAMVFELIGLIARNALLHFGQHKRAPADYDLAVFKAGITVDKAKKLFS